MAGRVGLTAVVAPELDESEARREAGRLEEAMESASPSIVPDVDTGGLRDAVQTGLAREGGRRLGRALPGRLGTLAGRSAGAFFEPSARGSDGEDGDEPVPSEPGVGEPALQSLVDLAEERNELLEDLVDDGVGGGGDGSGNLLKRLGDIGLGGLIGGGLAAVGLGSGLINFLENFEFEPPEVPDLGLPDEIPDLGVDVPNIDPVELAEDTVSLADDTVELADDTLEVTVNTVQEATESGQGGPSTLETAAGAAATAGSFIGDPSGTLGRFVGEQLREQEGPLYQGPDPLGLAGREEELAAGAGTAAVGLGALAGIGIPEPTSTVAGASVLAGMLGSAGVANIAGSGGEGGIDSVEDFNRDAMDLFGLGQGGVGMDPGRETGPGPVEGALANLFGAGGSDGRGEETTTRSRSRADQGGPLVDLTENYELQTPLQQIEQELERRQAESRRRAVKEVRRELNTGGRQ